MHHSILKFGHTYLTRELVEGKAVLEVGSMDVNGSLRSHVMSLNPASYLGVDLQEGPGVDQVMDLCVLPVEKFVNAWIGKFDLIVSTEMLEHAEDWRMAINNMKALLKPGGTILLTTRSFGFPRHGYPSDYWRFECEDMRKIFDDFTGNVFPDLQVPGVFVIAHKPKEEYTQVDLAGIDVYSMNSRPAYAVRGSHPVPTQSTSPVRVAGMLRVKNESRWIERVIKSIKPLCNGGIFILDDKSTDDTPEIARACGATVILSGAPGIDETRDKNALLKSIMELSNPDWVLHIDGDEELEPAGIDVIRRAIESKRAQTFTLPVLYLWDREDQIRVDGIFGRMQRESLFSTANTNGIFRSTIYGMGTAANLHCSNVPADLAKGAITIPARLIHYGYIDRAMRLRKWDFYNTVDPNNVLEDRYRHAVAGDIPEVPANIVTKWAGPVKLEPFTPREASVALVEKELTNA